jgi:hypothetical protein
LQTPNFCSLQAQSLVVSSGTDLVIKQGTVFSSDGLVLTPSADFTLSNVNITRNTTTTHPAINTYIGRVYTFSSGTAPFNGTIRVNYQDGAELNGLSETNLQLNTFNGSVWQAFPSATNDPVNNYVISGSISGLQLDELTLASALNPLPIQWRSFTATRQQDKALLQWSTFAELNSWSFIIQTSTNNITWNTLATVPAAGNSSTLQSYRYLHTSPAAGGNYYRVIQTDIDGKNSYSPVKKVSFETTAWHVELLGNPVRNGKLEIRVTLASPNDILPVLNLYAADGKILFTKQSTQGTQSINVSGYPKGTYILKANEKTLQFVVQ